MRSDGPSAEPRSSPYAPRAPLRGARPEPENWRLRPPVAPMPPRAASEPPPRGVLGEGRYSRPRSARGRCAWPSAFVGIMCVWIEETVVVHTTSPCTTHHRTNPRGVVPSPSATSHSRSRECILLPPTSPLHRRSALTHCTSKPSHSHSGSLNQQQNSMCVRAYFNWDCLCIMTHRSISPPRASAIWPSSLSAVPFPSQDASIEKK